LREESSKPVTISTTKTTMNPIDVSTKSKEIKDEIVSPAVSDINMLSIPDDGGAY
jgi:hypothetical protein